jgi:hypothetical protein
MSDAVLCHSGFAYPQRPRAVLWEDAYLEITELLSEWRTPAGKTFRVSTSDHRTFLLSYDESACTWQVDLL